MRPPSAKLRSSESDGRSSAAETTSAKPAHRAAKESFLMRTSTHSLDAQGRRKVPVSRRGLLIAAWAVVSSAGCFDYPLDPTPQVPIDSALLGTWRCLPVEGAADERPATVVVTSQGPREYAVSWREEKEGEEPDHYRVYLSSLPIPRLL